MGKFRKSKKSVANNKLDRPGRKEKADEQVKNDKILPLIAKLKSADFKDRVVAMSVVNSMIDDPNYRQLLLREKLLQVILSHSLSDQSQEIVAEGFGLLRNVVIEEGRDAAIYLYRQNILTTIKATIEKLEKVWTETKNLETLQGQDKVIVREFTENIFGLSCGLAMADDDIYDAVLELMNPLSGFLCRLLQSKFNLVHDVVLEFLYVMSEDEQAASVIVNSGLQAIVQRDLQPQNVASQVYKLGIIYNLIEVAQSGTESDLAEILQAIYNIICEFDVSIVVPAAEMDSTDPKKLKDAVLEQARVRSQINASQVAFEIIASIMVSWGHLPSPSHESLDFIGGKVAPLCIRALAHHNYALRACSSLNNIGWTFNVMQLEWNTLAEQIWEAAAPLTSTTDVSLLASVLGLLGAVAQLFDGNVPFTLQDTEAIANHLVELRPLEINLAFDDTKEYLHLLRMWYPLVCRIGQVPENFEICTLASSSIGVVLETPSEFGPELLSVCINCIFELYGDNQAPSNQIYLERDINKRLQNRRSEYKRVLKSVDKNNTALKEQCDETLLNLDRFIEYKATQKP